MNLKNLVFISCIITFSIIGFVIRNFPFSQGDLDTPLLPVITSYDVFANTDQIKWIYDSEQAYYYSPARTGGISSIISTHPTLYYIFIATFTKLTTLSPYQTAYLAVNLLSLLIILQLALLVRKLFGDTVAIIALALGSIPDYHWFFPMFIGFQYDYFTFATIPALIFLSIHRFETTISRTKKILLYTLFGFFLTEQFLGHYVELFFYAPFFITLPIIFIFLKRITFKEYLFAITIISIILLPFVLYFFPMTLKDHFQGGFTALKGQFSPEGTKHIDYFPWPRFNFWLNIFSGIGILTLFITFKKNLHPPRIFYLLFLGYLLFVGFSNYTLGVWANRAERQLFQGYPFLLLFPALGISTLITLFITIIRQEKVSSITTLAVILFITFTTFPTTYTTLKNIDHGAFVDENKWASIAWIRDVTPKDSRVFFLSGFEHEFSMLSERVNLKGDLNRGYTVENIRALCAQKYPEKYGGEWAFREYANYGTGMYARKRTGILTFEDIVEPFQNDSEGYVFKGPDRGNQWVPLSFFDYVVLQYRGTGFDPCMVYFLNESNNRGHTIVWHNDAMAIVKINKNSKVTHHASQE